MALTPREHGFPSLPLIGRSDYAHAQPGLLEHRHAGAMEICYLARGRQTYMVGRRRFLLKGGDIFLTFPDEVHRTGGEPEQICPA